MAHCLPAPGLRMSSPWPSAWRSLAPRHARPSSTWWTAAWSSAVEHLEVEEGTAVISCTRIRCADGEPIAVLSNLIPASIAPTLEELEAGGLYDLLRAQDIIPTTAKQVIGARNATTREADLLNERRRAALLTATRTTYDQSGRVIEYGQHIYRASRYTFETSLFSS